MKKTARCSICRHKLPTLKTIRSHYLSHHSKIQIVQEVLRNDLLLTTPNVLSRRKSKKRKCSGAKITDVLPETIIFHKNIHITYDKNENTIIIQDDSSNDNTIELTLDESNNCQVPLLNNNNDQSVDSNLAKHAAGDNNSADPPNRLHLNIVKIKEAKQSLNPLTGEFYECHCMDDSTTKKTGPYQEVEGIRVYYCRTCQTCYKSPEELAIHERVHWVFCKICNRYFTFQGYKEHFEQHVVRIYVCHLCHLEFISGEKLKQHLDYHFEQQIFEDVLDMERDYDLHNYWRFRCGGGGDDKYQSNINNIMMYLARPYDRRFCKNVFFKVICDICRGDFYIYDYERHLKTAHFIS